jgi:hypothetical protein
VRQAPWLVSRSLDPILNDTFNDRWCEASSLHLVKGVP